MEKENSQKSESDTFIDKALKKKREQLSALLEDHKAQQREYRSSHRTGSATKTKKRETPNLNINSLTERVYLEKKTPRDIRHSVRDNPYFTNRP